MCCSSWGHKEWDTTEWLNWTESKGFLSVFSSTTIQKHPFFGAQNIRIAPQISNLNFIYKLVFKTRYGPFISDKHVPKSFFLGSKLSSDQFCLLVALSSHILSSWQPLASASTVYWSFFTYCFWRFVFWKKLRNWGQSFFNWEYQGPSKVNFQRRSQP